MIKWLIGVLCCLAFIIFLVPKPALLHEFPFSQAVYDEHHHLLRITLTPDDKYRLYTPLDQISPLVIETTLLQEDQYFFQHPGVNPVAIIKAAWQTYLMHTRSFGASTITMQVARLRFGINSKTMTGKIWQIIKAVQLEIFYSKKEILEAYFNLAPYGSNIEGIGSASTIYFDKPAGQLNLLEALGLSVIPQNPSKRGLNSLSLQAARNKLFQRWVQQHPEDTSKSCLMDLPMQFDKKHLPFLAPHFVDWILQTNKATKIISTLDLKLQSIIERMTRRYLEQQRQYGVYNAAAMLVDSRSMEVKALVGSGNFFDSSINGQVNGSRSKRSPGSTLKPFIYSLALDQGIIHPNTVLKDAPRSFGDYNPENFDRDFLGPIKAKEALILSRNIPAIDLAEQLTSPNLYQFLQQANVGGLKQEREYGLSLVLGGAEVTMEELVCLYAMLANNGIWHSLRTTLKAPLSLGKRLLSPEASFLTLEMLRETPRPYPTSASMDKQIPVYWKTGTSSGYRDAWAIGIFGPYVLAIWIGDFTGKGNPSFIGVSAAAPLFFNIIEAISTQAGNLQDLVKDRPEMNLTKVEVCEASGLIPAPCCPHTVPSWFIPGRSPIATCNVHREIAIDPKTGLRTRCINKDTQFIVYEFWPSNLLKIFTQAGMKRRIPPPFDALSSIENYGEGIPPKIVSPQQDLIYTIRLNNEENPLLFYAVADADVKTLHWFVGNDFIGSCERDKSMSWQAKSGIFSVRVVDDHGRADVKILTVKTVE